MKYAIAVDKFKDFLVSIATSDGLYAWTFIDRQTWTRRRPQFLENEDNGRKRAKERIVINGITPCLCLT